MNISFRKVLLSFFAVVVSAVFANASAQDSITLPSNLQDDLKKLQLGVAPKLAIQTLRFDISTGSKSEKNYERFENGMWGVTELGNNGLARSLTLGGMLELVSAMDVVSQQTTTVPLAAGKGFIPFGLTTTSQTSLYRNTKGVTGDLGAITRPQPNSSFSYSQVSEGLLTISSGLMKFKKTLSYETDVTCTTGSLAEAKSLHPDLKGTYFPIRCNGKDKGGPEFSREYVHLVDSGIYVLLENKTEKQHEVYKVTAFEYAK